MYTGNESKAMKLSDIKSLFMNNTQKSFYITKDGEVVTDIDDIDDALTISHTDKDIQLPIEFSSNTYSEELALKLARKLSEYKDMMHATDFEWTDVRYAPYYNKEKEKFVPVCIQDFDVKDYEASMFLTDALGDTIEFYRADYQNLDDVAKALCSTVCDELNKLFDMDYHFKMYMKMA